MFWLCFVRFYLFPWFFIFESTIWCSTSITFIHFIQYEFFVSNIFKVGICNSYDCVCEIRMCSVWMSVRENMNERAIPIQQLVNMIFRDNFMNNYFNLFILNFDHWKVSFFFFSFFLMLTIDAIHDESVWPSLNFHNFCCFSSWLQFPIKITRSVNRCSPKPIRVVAFPSTIRVPFVLDFW